MPDQTPQPPHPLRERARQAVAAAAARIADYAKVTLPEIQLDFGLKGRCAGQACMDSAGQLTVRINLALLQGYPDDYLSVTIPHEVCHLAVNWQHRKQRRKPRAHGSEWQALMREGFGLEPRRCHNYQTTPARVVPRNFLYRCGCREHRLTRIMHNRIRKAGGALCRGCQGALQFSQELK